MKELSVRVIAMLDNEQERKIFDEQLDKLTENAVIKGDTAYVTYEHPHNGDINIGDELLTQSGDELRFEVIRLAIELRQALNKRRLASQKDGRK